MKSSKSSSSRTDSIERLSWEIEAKVTLFNRFSLPEPLNEDNVWSEHRFFYDQDDKYLFSVTDNRKMKTKTDRFEVKIDGVCVLVRKEHICQIPDRLPSCAGFRLVERRRSSKIMGPCLVTVDYLNCNGAPLIQMEAEYVEDVNTFGQGLVAMQVCANTVRLLIDNFRLPHEFNSPEKYEWAKAVSPLLPIVRENKGWIQRIFGS